MSGCSCRDGVLCPLHHYIMEQWTNISIPIYSVPPPQWGLGEWCNVYPPILVVEFKPKHNQTNKVSIPSIKKESNKATKQQSLMALMSVNSRRRTFAHCLGGKSITENFNLRKRQGGLELRNAVFLFLPKMDRRPGWKMYCLGAFLKW